MNRFDATLSAQMTPRLGDLCAPYPGMAVDHRHPGGGGAGVVSGGTVLDETRGVNIAAGVGEYSG